MKINKILAAGIAATLAVTSLSAVVSAEVQTKTFEVYRTKADFSGVKLQFNADVNKTIAQKLRQSTTGKIVLEDIDYYVRHNLNYQSFVDWAKDNDEDLYNKYKNNPEKFNNGSDMQIDGITLTATGYQHIGDTATVTKTFKFLRDNADWNGYSSSNPNGTDKDWTLVVLDDATPIYHDGEFASYFFSEITSLQLEVSLKGSTLIEDEYNWWVQRAWKNAGLNIGDILVYKNSTDAAANFEYRYGIEGHAADRAEIDSVQATEALKDVAAKDAAPDAANVGYGVIIGSAALATDVGSQIKSNQKAGTITGDEMDVYKMSAAATAAHAIVFTDITTPQVTIDAGTVVDGKYVEDGYLYEIDDGTTKYYIYSATKLEATSKCIGTEKTETLVDYLGALAAASTPLAVGNAIGYTVLDQAPVAAPVVLEENVSDHLAIVPAAATDTTKIAANGVVLMTVKNGVASYSYQVNAWDGAWTAMDLSDTDSTAHLLAYAFADGGYYESRGIYGDGHWWDLGNVGIIQSIAPTTTKQNGWLPKTTKGSTKTIKNKIERSDVWELSTTNSQKSSGQSYAQEGVKKDGDQTYEATFWEGTNPYGFAGLASQVADFFNKQDNGTITFTFAADAGNTSGKWTDGVPSTEVGLKGFTSEYLNDFALFFNYDNTTGTMLSAIKLDPTAGTVTFDISDYLKDCGGLTKATLENIHYGLDNGIQYEAGKNVYGLWVSKVELAYDDAGVAVDANTDDDAADDDAAVVVADDDDDEADDDVIADDDDDIIEDDDDDDDDAGEIIEDDDDDDDDVNNDVDYVDADDDANPGTGVGLAVIPAIVAGAALVVSKKRK